MLFSNILSLSILYFFFQLILYRFLNININKISTIIIVLIFSVIFLSEIKSYHVTLSIICLNLTIVCLYILLPGLINKSPAFILIKILNKKKSLKISKIKKLFILEMKTQAIEKRFNINLKSNFIKKDKKIYRLTNKGKSLITILDFLTKVFKLKPDI